MRRGRGPEPPPHPVIPKIIVNQLGYDLLRGRGNLNLNPSYLPLLVAELPPVSRLFSVENNNIINFLR